MIIVDSCELYFLGDPETNQLACIKPKTGQVQKYSDIIKAHSTSNPFIDPEFPHVDENIGHIGFDPAAGAQTYKDWNKAFHWKRIQDFVNVTKDEEVKSLKISFYEPEPKNANGEKYSRHDIKQGMIGDCWFISSLAELTHHPDLMHFVVPDDNLKNNDSGAYHFRLGHNGIWIDVVVDDYVPCAEFLGPGNGWTLLGLNPRKSKTGSPARAKIWMILAEKAYAKLNGSYSELENNLPHNAMEDLTGGLGYCEVLQKVKVENPDYVENFWIDMKNYFENGNNFMVFGTSVAKIPPEGYLGLHTEHAYTLTGLTVVELPDKKQVRLVRLRNPWGKGEWVGDWSDGSPAWNLISPEQKAKIGLTIEEDGEFWIDYIVALHLFTQVDFCLGIQLLQSKLGQQAKTINKLSYHGSWSIEKEKAGGAENPPKNPQYIIPIGNPDSTETCDMLIALQPKTTLKNISKLNYGYMVYWISDPTYQRYKLVDGWNFGPDFFEATQDNTLIKTAGSAYGFDTTTTYTFGRDVAGRFKVKPGTYLIVPTTGEPNVEADYVLRLWYDAYSPIGIVTSIETLEVKLDGTMIHTIESLDDPERKTTITKPKKKRTGGHIPI